MADLAHEEFSRFFEEKKKGTYHCPICNNIEFAVNLTGPPGVPGPVVQLPMGSPGQVHLMASFSCTNCGHTDFFHMHQIDAWRTKKAAEAKKAGGA